MCACADLHIAGSVEIVYTQPEKVYYNSFDFLVVRLVQLISVKNTCEECLQARNY